MKVSTCLYSYRFERFELQPSERRLLAAGVPAVVDPRAFDVLIALVERAGHLVTKEELFSLVWPRLVVEENNLQVQVSALRKILGPAAIATVSGQGYRFTLEVSREVIDVAPPAIAAKSHLPRLITSFTGSGRELADVKELLGDTRLLTLVGADRIGKTRLLLQVSADVRDEYPDGVWFVDLAPSRDARRVPQAVASVLGVKEEAVRPVVETLLRYVKDRRLLLILDNCGHLTHACTELAAGLLQSSPHLKLLVSSREQLHMAGESIYPVPGLTNIASPIRAFPDALEGVPNAHEQAARRHPLAQWSRWQWIAGGAAVFLIAGAGAWLLPTTKTTPLTTVTAEPPALSIAILPFAAPDDEQLAKMLLPELTAAFGRVARSARIASPGLVASYKENQVDARVIGHEVNVRYVAEGEIRRAGDTRLFSARLIDAANGAQIWSERFEVPAEELPTSQDAFATRVGVHLWTALFRAEQDRAAHQSPTSLTATDFWLRGVAVDDESLNNALAARKLYEKALQLDPRLVGAMRSLGGTYMTELDLNPHADGDRLRRDLDELSLRAVATDRADWRAWYLRGYALRFNSRWEEALESTAELQRIDPNLSIGFAQRAVALITLGRFEEALAQVEQGLTSDPSGPDVAYLMRQKCKVYSYMGQYEKAIPTCEKAATLKEMESPYLFLTADFAQLGEMDKAASAKTRLLKLDPGFSIARFKPGAAAIAPNPVWLQQAETSVIAGLRKAGIPEK
jgi:DNA-binding winged helix-turn-helix (wHTH) protein/TolB-like protein/tetratricopeptide (TPR) repeat protein